MARVRMAVIRHPANSDPPVFLVRPAAVFLLRGTSSDSFRLLNFTGLPITFVMPGEGPFGNNLEELVQHGHWLDRPVDPNIQRGPYAYKVKLTINSKEIEALGNSDPVIIVDDP